MFVLVGSTFKTGMTSNRQFQSIFHRFDCPCHFETIFTRARMKVVPELNVQLLEFDLKDQEELSMQILMPIHASLGDLIANFQSCFTKDF